MKNCSYLSQVRQIRALAERALELYSLNSSRRLEFINHGENTTFRVRTAGDSGAGGAGGAGGGQDYLLRIHRPDYHTPAAINRELSWLAELAKLGFAVPRPLQSKAGRLLETVTHSRLADQRNCCLFHWIKGRFINKSLSVQHLYQVGRLLAEFQLATGPGREPAGERLYWDADGLLGDGDCPKFGQIDQLVGLDSKRQEIITAARRRIHARLLAFQHGFPERLGLIHADLHFGNLLKPTGASNNDRTALAAIDFDDCGYGFYAYDLAIPIVSALNFKPDRAVDFKQALLEGYRSLKPFDREDEEIFELMIPTRRLVMLGWLNSRSDNPQLKSHLAGAIDRTFNLISDFL